MDLYKFLIISFSLLISTTAYAVWDKQCLDECFSTGHECNFCNWHCEVEERTPYKYYHNQVTCPFGNDYSGRCE